jgi:surface antigen
VLGFLTFAPSQEAHAQAASVKPALEYTVVEGDYLDKIATEHGSTWQTVQAKNPEITNPDLIFPEQKIKLPVPGEVAVPVAPVAKPDSPVTHVEAPLAAPSPKPVQTTTPAPQPVVEAPVRTIPPVVLDSYNGYDAGQCTWHVKNLRPDLPNNLGNADQWYYNAQSQGLPTGTEPRVGAAAVRNYGMHVAFVEAVNGDGTITISEMNYQWVPFETREAVVSASDYSYIY